MNVLCKQSQNIDTTGVATACEQLRTWSNTAMAFVMCSHRSGGCEQVAWPNGPNMGVTLLGCGSGWVRVGTVGNLAENGSTECKLVGLALKHQARSKTTKNTDNAIVMKKGH